MRMEIAVEIQFPQIYLRRRINVFYFARRRADLFVEKSFLISGFVHNVRDFRDFATDSIDVLKINVKILPILNLKILLFSIFILIKFYDNLHMLCI